MLESGFFRLLSLHYDENSILLKDEKWSTKIEYNKNSKDDKHFSIKRGRLHEQHCYYIHPEFLKVIPLYWKNHKFNEATDVHISFPSARAVNETTFEGRVQSTLHYTIVYEDWSFHLFFDTNGVEIFTLVHYKNIPYSLSMDEHSFLKNAFQPHIQFLRKLFEQKAKFLSKIENELIDILSGITDSISSVQKSRVSTLLQIKHQCTDHVAIEKNEEEVKFEIFLSELRATSLKSIPIKSIENNNKQNLITSFKDKSRRERNLPSHKVVKLRKKNVGLSGETLLGTRINDFAGQLQKHFDSPSLEDIQKILNNGWGKINLAEQYRIFLDKLLDFVDRQNLNSETQKEQIRIIEYLQKKYINLQSVVFSLDNEKTFYHPTWHAECKLLGWFFLHGQIDLFNCFIRLGIDPALEYVTYIVRYSGDNAIWEDMNKEYYDLVKEDSQEYEFSFLQNKRLKENEIRFKLTSRVSVSYQTSLTNGKYRPLPYVLYLHPKCKDELNRCIKTKDCSSLSSNAKTVILQQLCNDGSLHSSFRKYRQNLFDYVRIHTALLCVQQNSTSQTRFKVCPRHVVSDPDTFCLFFVAFIENDEKLAKLIFQYDLFLAINQAMGFIKKPMAMQNRIIDLLNLIVNYASFVEEKKLFILCLCMLALDIYVEFTLISHDEKIIPSTILLGGCLLAGFMFFSKQKTNIATPNVIPNEAKDPPAVVQNLI